MRRALPLLTLLAACKGEGETDDTDVVDTDAADTDDTDVADTDDTDDTDVVDTDATWEFDVGALLDGARSDVPDEVMAAYPDGLGGHLTRHSAVTGVEFHVPGFVSSERMSATPTPVLRDVNGTRFWEVTGELSGRFVDDLGIYGVVGPIDEQGVNHRAETFDPYEPDVDANDTYSHPRAGLPGAFFVIRWPEQGYNGAIVQHQAPNDGGSDYPQAPLAWQHVDPLALLDAGYAVVSLGTGGSMRGRVEDDGSITVDSNPDSGSGIFWTEDWSLNPWEGVLQNDENALVTTVRPVLVDDALAESPMPLRTRRTYDLVHWDDELQMEVVAPLEIELGDPTYIFAWMFAAPELIADAHVVFENFVGQATGTDDAFGLYLGWSGSGGPAWMLATGLQTNASFQYDESLGVAPGGGNFHTWGDPASGRVFEAFVVFAGAHPWPSWASQTLPDDSWTGADADYPLQAPYVAIHADNDLVLPSAFAYLHANGVARAWPTSEMADEDIDDWHVILQPEFVTHGSHAQLFTTRDEGVGDEGALWYDRAYGYEPEALNDEGRGRRITEPYARMIDRNGTELVGFLADMVDSPRLTPMYLATFAALRERVEDGAPLPVSRVDPKVFDDVSQIDETASYPRVPACLPADYDWDQFVWDDVVDCEDGLTGNTTLFGRTYLPWEVDAIHEFAADNPMSRSLEPLRVPDVAAPVGDYLGIWSLALRRDYSEEELAALYVDHAGYVAAVEAATDTLVDQGLWDADLGAVYVIEAEQSDVLAP